MLAPLRNIDWLSDQLDLVLVQEVDALNLQGDGNSFRKCAHVRMTLA
jgi:hypothetical protein